LREGDCDAIKRGPDGRLEPTKVTRTLRRFQYSISKTGAHDRLFRFGELDGRHPAGGRLRGVFRRGFGAARLHLAAAAQRRGQLATVVATTCGNTLIDFKQPKDESRPSIFKVSYFVATMDTGGHILWPTVFSAESKAKVRKKLRQNLAAMMAPPSQHPVDPAFSGAFVGTGGNTLWKPAPRQVLGQVEEEE